FVVNDEFQEVIAFGAIAAHVRFAAVGVHRSQRTGKRAANRSELVDRVGDGNELPCRAVVLRVEQGLLEPCKLCGAEISTVRVVGARSGVVRGCIVGLQSNIPVRAGVSVDEEDIPSPANSGIELLCAVCARIARSVQNATVSYRLVGEEYVFER